MDNLQIGYVPSKVANIYRHPRRRAALRGFQFARDIDCDAPGVWSPSGQDQSRDRTAAGSATCPVLSAAHPALIARWHRGPFYGLRCRCSRVLGAKAIISPPWGFEPVSGWFTLFSGGSG